ncbi:unnamed protein product [Phytophthora lilii]|uniref:Unnamed protein product n=1 Tax=Phytophthora lilii TaxID=2077276 RepID=A0A9W6YJS3_9STRA|nr:unnamed protein product [Phytophthora lilii]
MSNINASVLDLLMSVAIFGCNHRLLKSRAEDSDQSPKTRTVVEYSAKTAPSSSGSVDTSSSSAPADIGSSSPDGSSILPSATAAVETRAVQVCSGSHGTSNLASAESSSPAPPTSVVTREVLEELLVEASAESSERVIAVLGPRLEQLGRLAVGLQVAPSIRGVDAAKSLEEVVNAAVPCMDVGGDVTLYLATMRGQLYSAEAAQAAAEKSLHQEIYRRENAEEREILFASNFSVARKPRRSWSRQWNSGMRSSPPTTRFVNPAGVLVIPCRQLTIHCLSSGLSTGELDWEALGVSDDTRTILRQMYQSADKSNPDTLIADSLARVVFAEGDSLGKTSSAARASEFRKPRQVLLRRRLAADAAGQRDVDDSRDVASSRGEAEDTEASADLEFSSPAPSTPRSNVESRPSGFSKAKSKSRSSSSSESSAWSASTQQGFAAQSSFKSSLMCELEDADDEDVLGGSSPPLTRPRSSSRPIVIDDDSNDDSESGVESERMTVPENTVDSRVDNSRSVGSEASAVPRSNVSGHSPAREASASGALAPSDGSSAVPTSREVSVLPEIGSVPVAATRESESPASTALVVRDSSIPAPPSAKTGAVQKSAAKTQAKAKKSSQKKKRARSTKAPSESSVPGVAPSESSAAARSSSSRSQSRRRQANRPQVDASMS